MSDAQWRPGESIGDYVERRAQDPTSFVAMRRAMQATYIDLFMDLTAENLSVSRGAVEYPRHAMFSPRQRGWRWVRWRWRVLRARRR